MWNGVGERLFEVSEALLEQVRDEGRGVGALFREFGEEQGCELLEPGWWGRLKLVQFGGWVIDNSPHDGPWGIGAEGGKTGCHGPEDAAE